MSRFLTFLLIAVALTNVASGDLLRPCECAAQGPDACGMCPGSRAESTSQAPAPC